MNKHPKVKFLLPSAKREANVFYWFCFPRQSGWDWSYLIYNYHPELKLLVAGVKNKNKFCQLCQQYAKKIIKEKQDELGIAKINFQKDWDKIEKEYFNILTQHFDTDFPKNRKIIKAYVSINPMCPRFLDEWSFHITFNRQLRFKRIAMHEILHFLYFKKWLEVFPQTKRRELDSPHLVWKLSEILATVILNNNPRMKKFGIEKTQGYGEFQKIRIGGKHLIPYFEELYIRHLKNDGSFADFLKLCWTRVLRYKNILEKI